MKKAFRYEAWILPLNVICFLLMLASFGFRVFRAVLPHADATAESVIFSFCFPLMAAIVFGTLLLFRGRRTHLTVWPYTLMAVSYIMEFTGEKPLTLVLGIVITVILWALYVSTLEGRISFSLPLALIHVLVLGLHMWGLFTADIFPQRIEMISLCCFWAGITVYLFSLKKEVLDHPYRRLGDRSDGRLIRSRSPMDRVASYVMADRIGAANQFRDELEIAKTEKYILQKRKEGLKGFGLMHVLVAAYIRTISEHPAVNRFVSGQKVYARDDLIEINLTVKKEFREEAPETVVKFTFDPTMTAQQVYYITQAEVMKNKNDLLDADMDHTAAILAYIPGLFLKSTFWFLKLLDYFGLLPRFLTKVSPFHGSLFMTSMGSLGIPPVQHHLYSFGNIPAFLAFGPKKKKNILNDDGTVSERRYCEFTVTCDDRICDGFTYASAFKTFKKYVANPYLLDTPPEKVIRDID